MNKKKGTLTGTQLEIMEVVWERGRPGASTGEIWQELAKKRQVARTTVLTMVQRLEKRGWLVRIEDEGTLRFRATSSRDRTTDQLTANFIEQVFGGSPELLVRSILGSRRIKADELARIKQLLSDHEEEQ
jgi:BlaI family transcriptional regulator, penicillinase repressor